MGAVVVVVVVAVVVDSTGGIVVAAAVVTSVVVADVGLNIDYTDAAVDNLDPMIGLVDFDLDSIADLDIDTLVGPIVFVVAAVVHLLLHRLHLHFPTT